MNFIKSKEIFLKKCNAKNLSVNTLEYYRYALENFFKFTAAENIESVEDVKGYHMIEYFNGINEKYSKVTIKGRYVAINAYFKFLMEMEIIGKNPMSIMEKPKISKKIIYAFSRKEVQEILDYYDLNDFIGYRNYIMMNVLFSTGIRKGELVTMATFDIDYEEDLIRIVGKGDKERFVPLGKSLRKLLATYIKRRKEFLKDKDNQPSSLFVTKSGTPLSISGVNTIFRHLTEARKQWSTRVSAHTFRHTFAKYYLLNGGDIFSLQKILGHEDISTTRLYIDLIQDDIKTQNARYNPLDNKAWQYC